MDVWKLSAYFSLQAETPQPKRSEKEVPEPGRKPDKGASGSEEDDISESLNKELGSLKAQVTTRPHQRKFQILESGAANFLFIQTTVPDPLLLVTKIMEDVYQTKKQKARFMQRLLPVEATCKANIEDVRAAFEPLLEKYFAKEGKTFSIIFEKRNSHALDRTKVIEDLAEMVALKNTANRADLKQPQLAILVEVVRNMCLLSVLPNYYMYKKYNLFELSQTEQDKKSDEDIVSTEAGVVYTEAGVVSTEADVVSSEADVVSTEAADNIAANGDKKETHLEKD
uniref:THUMP domain-containing protein n=1 Tax=Timema cristinae TaxID=61476 RepID=A0A7R9C9N2_TIMCR|nr:unnamed protein product [Timema cristinae]